MTAQRVINPLLKVCSKMKLVTLFSKTDIAQSDIKTKVIRIDAPFAASCLTNFNDSNRPLSRAVAKLYANETLRGNWKQNGEPLIFSVDQDGNEHLISGQHRLTGLVMAQQAIDKGEDWPSAETTWDVVVVYGVQHDTADTVDTGKARNHSDVLFRDPWVDTVIPDKWNDTVNARKTWTKTLAGAARLVWLIEGGALVSSAPKFVISEMLSFIQNRHPLLGEFVTTVLNADDADGGNRGLKMSLAHLAALTYVASIYEDNNGEICINKDTAELFRKFLEEVASGTGFTKGGAANALTGYWNKLTAEKGSKDRDRDWVGPFVKIGLALIEGREGLKLTDVSLTKKERDNYADFPIMFDGHHTICFERAAAIKAAATQAKEDAHTELDDSDDSNDNPDPKPPIKRKPSKPSSTKTKTTA